jgi:hypothetical protein
MRRFMTVLTLTAIGILVTLPAAAADNGFYLGLSAGQTDVTGEGNDDVVFSGDDLGYKVFAGYRFLTFLAVEGSYVDFGAPDDESEGVHTEFDLTGFDLYAMGLLPLGIADIFVKAGMVEWDADLTTDIAGPPYTASADGTDPAYGLGFQLRFGSFTARAEVEYFDVESANHLYMYSLGGAFTF